MYFLGDFVLLTPLAIVLDIAVLLSAFALGLFGYIRQIGAWAFLGILVIIFGAMNLMPEDGAPITILGLTGLTLGVMLGVHVFVPQVYVRQSTRTQGSRSAYSHAGPSGFEDVESDLNEQADDAADNEESNRSLQVQTENKDYYGVLGVERSASARDIKLAYRSVMKNCHPDLFPGDKEKEAMAKEVNEAFDVLGDDQKRAAFDRYGFVA